MGWANCGDDSKGRPIGYAHGATCDEPGCKKRIHRGLAYVCGDMHGEDEISCEGYFCGDHVETWKVKGERRYVRLCKRCLAVAHEHGALEE